MQIIREAEGYKEERIKRAEGDAQKFLSVLKEYEKAKDVTRKRLYLETMEEVLPGNMLQLLPLAEWDKAKTIPGKRQ